MAEYRLVAPCYFGAEKTLGFEVKKAGGQDIALTDGRVYFSGDETVIAACNIKLRTAERILVLLCNFKATTFDELFDGIFAIPFEEIIPKTAAFPVKGASLQSILSSVPACQSIVKKAIVKRLQKGHKTEFLTERGDTYQVRFSIRKDIVEVFLDTSGDGLHKRGYRRISYIAPLKETLAATVCDLARVRTDSIVEDPFCGSGTLIIEAAQKALHIAPGLKRTFAAEINGFVAKDVWQKQREIAAAERIDCPGFIAAGFDIDTDAIEIATQNARLAGVEGHCVFKVSDVKNYTPKKGAVVLANPPYGERIGSKEEAALLIKTLSKRLKNTDACAYILSPLQDFEQLFAKSANRRRKLYNGMMMCQLFMYF